MKLKEKYLPASYHQRLLDHWQRLSQGNKSVSDYITKFDEYAIRCNIKEDESMVLSRFRAGRHEDIQREIFLREVGSLEQAYQIARNYKRFQKAPITCRPEPIRTNSPNPRPGPSQAYPNWPNPNPA